jgi:hypothetical protein
MTEADKANKTLAERLQDAINTARKDVEIIMDAFESRDITPQRCAVACILAAQLIANNVGDDTLASKLDALWRMSAEAHKEYIKQKERDENNGSPKPTAQANNN